MTPEDRRQQIIDVAIQLFSQKGFRGTTTKEIALGDGRIVEVKLAPIPDGGWVATHEDVTDEHRTRARVLHMSRHDALTGLPNRTLLDERLREGLTRTKGDCTFALHIIDLDHFKNVNDTLGHAMGDKLLQVVTERLQFNIKANDTMARLGGDEFAIIQADVTSLAEVTSLAQRIIELAARPCEIDGHQIEVGASVGIVLAPADGNTPEQLLRSADLALYRAKEMGRGGYHFFEPALDHRVQKRRTLEIELRQAITTGQFELLYQPLLAVSSKEIVGVEALIRWRHPERGMISPLDFIPLAEETGLIVPIGEWALRQACSLIAQWPPHIRVAVNLSPVQFRKLGLVQTVISALASSGLAPQRLELEIGVVVDRAIETYTREFEEPMLNPVDIVRDHQADQRPEARANQAK